MAPLYMIGMVNALGLFEPIGLETHTAKEARAKKRWQHKGGNKACVVALVAMLPRRLIVDFENQYREITNSGYTAEAFEAFCKATWKET